MQLASSTSVCKVRDSRKKPTQKSVQSCEIWNKKAFWSFFQILYCFCVVCWDFATHIIDSHISLCQPHAEQILGNLSFFAEPISFCIIHSAMWDTLSIQIRACAQSHNQAQFTYTKFCPFISAWIRFTDFADDIFSANFSKSSSIKWCTIHTECWRLPFSEKDCRL